MIEKPVQENHRFKKPTHIQPKAPSTLHSLITQRTPSITYSHPTSPQTYAVGSTHNQNLIGLQESPFGLQESLVSKFPKS